MRFAYCTLRFLVWQVEVSVGTRDALTVKAPRAQRISATPQGSSLTSGSKAARLRRTGQGRA
jgi:hypothetical protein